MKSPLVTVVTPSYNQGRFIRATIESVLSQDYPHLEYIIMDGGSTDETSNIVSEYGSRLSWISERDRGQSHAINKGFRMARGEIVSWLNSDDIILPGAVGHAVRAFERNPSLGAVYGEGYRIDIEGKVKTNFGATEPFNLWKLIYLRDYILQQTAYFRRDIFETIGYLDESLQWGMDWDLFIRIGKRYSMEYLPEYMGSIREYPSAKSFAGGGKRFRELAQIMHRHSGIRYPPGYWTYGLDTYIPIWCEWIERNTPALLKWPMYQVLRALRLAGGYIVERKLRTAQGLYSDGWAGPRLKYMLGPGSGRVMFEGSIPGLGRLPEKQILRIYCNGAGITSFRMPRGQFRVTFDVPRGCEKEVCSFVVEASHNVIPALAGISNDFRRLAYVLKTFAWVDPRQ